MAVPRFIFVFARFGGRLYTNFPVFLELIFRLHLTERVNQEKGITCIASC